MELITEGRKATEGDDEDRLRLSYGKLRQEFENNIVAQVSNNCPRILDRLGVREVVDRVLDSLKAKVFEDDLPDNWNWRAWINEKCYYVVRQEHLRLYYDELRQEFGGLIVAQVSKVLGSPTHHGVREVVDCVLDSLKTEVFKDNLPDNWNWRAWISARSQQRSKDYLRRFGGSRQISVSFNELESANDCDQPSPYVEARAAFNMLSSETSLGYSIYFTDEIEFIERFLAAAANQCKITSDEMIAWKVLGRADKLPANKTRNAFNAAWKRFLDGLCELDEDIERASRGEATLSGKTKSLESLHQQFQEKSGIPVKVFRILIKERLR